MNAAKKAEKLVAKFERANTKDRKDVTPGKFLHAFGGPKSLPRAVVFFGSNSIGGQPYALLCDSSKDVIYEAVALLRAKGYQVEDTIAFLRSQWTCRIGL